MGQLNAGIVPVTPFQQNCTILFDTDTRKGVVVDPGGDVDRILAVLKDKDAWWFMFFYAVTFGGFVGLPSPPAPLAAELLPLLERELRVAASRADLAHDPLAALAGTLDAG